MTQEVVSDENTLDILVENMGRVNFVTVEDKVPFEVLGRKGITGSVAIDGHVKDDWKIYSFEFPPPFMKRLVCVLTHRTIPHTCTYTHTHTNLYIHTRTPSLSPAALSWGVGGSEVIATSFMPLPFTRAPSRWNKCQKTRLQT